MQSRFGPSRLPTAHEPQTRHYGLHVSPEPVLHPVYLPFAEEQLLKHFAPVARRTRTEEGLRHLGHYRASVERLAAFEAGPRPTGKDARSLTRRARQIEKDERFWVVAALMAAYYSSDRVESFARLLTTALGERPPVDGLDTWAAALSGRLHLFFEVNLPSPPAYRRWLRERIATRTLIPYVREAAADAGTRLEGPTHVDALLLNEDTGFGVLFEAKVISDCDSKVVFDVVRNQIARNVDVMLDANPRLVPPLTKRSPTRTCFVLLTPELFKQQPRSRLYGWLLSSYRQHPQTLAHDLAHRDEGEVGGWPAVSRRLGWLTFEDCERMVPGACRWLREDELVRGPSQAAAGQSTPGPTRSAIIEAIRSSASPS